MCYLTLKKDAFKAHAVLKDSGFQRRYYYYKRRLFFHLNFLSFAGDAREVAIGLYQINDW